LDLASTYIRGFFVAAWLAGVTAAWAGTNSLPHVYTNGFKVALALGNDLYETLDGNFQKRLQPDPVEMEAMDAPVITPAMTDDATGKLGQVIISAGFIDLLNHVAHAKAIDRIQPGYFEQYACLLGRQTVNDTVPELFNMVDPRFWTIGVMNDQMSYFNQMIGLTLAINLSHHYLGHYNQYASQMLAGKLTPINNFIAPDEWETSVRVATLNSLDTGLATDGPRALFEVIDKMPKRPAWAAYLVPPATDLKMLNQRLTDYETNYWRGQLTLGGLAKVAAK
jgi:hypothetical protein